MNNKHNQHLIDTLQQLGQQTDKGQTHHGRADVQVGRGAGVAAGATGAGGTASSAVVRAGVVESASELALDVAVSALGTGGVLLQGLAVGLDVLSGADSERTDNVVEGRELDTKVLLGYSRAKVDWDTKTYASKEPPSFTAPPTSASTAKPVTFV